MYTVPFWIWYHQLPWRLRHGTYCRDFFITPTLTQIKWMVGRRLVINVPNTSEPSKKGSLFLTLYGMDCLRITKYIQSVKQKHFWPRMVRIVMVNQMHSNSLRKAQILLIQATSSSPRTLQEGTSWSSTSMRTIMKTPTQKRMRRKKRWQWLLKQQEH